VERRRLVLWLGAPLGLALVLVAWYLISPLFIRSTVVEESPLFVVVASPVGTVAPPTSTPAPIAIPATPLALTPPPTVVEAAPAVTRTPPTSTPVPTPAGPRILAQGTFDVKDAIHRGTGSAILARTADGKLVVRFENFSVTNGPDLYVYLSAHPDPNTSAELHTGGLELNLGRLRAPQGAFTYELPDDLNLDNVKSVNVYCRAFTTMFSSAELKPT
jgi:hypothetical protein